MLTIQERALQDVADAIKEARPKADVIFWIGAGASISAGIPSAEGVVDHFLERLWLNEQPRQDNDQFLCPSWGMPVDRAKERKEVVRAWALITGNVPALDKWRAANPGSKLNVADSDWWKLYSTCMDSFSGPAATQAFITEVVQRRKSVNPAHLRLAYMMHKNLITTVITTNFDDLLKRALAVYEEFPADLDGDSIDQLIPDAPFPQIAYLHGKLTSYRQRHTHAQVKGKLRGFDGYLRHVLTTGSLVIVGYRGGEETPMDVLHRVICRQKCTPGRGLYWISRETVAKDLTARVRDILEHPCTYWVPGADADEFLDELCLKAFGPVPPVPAPPLESAMSALEYCRRASSDLECGRKDQAIVLCKRALLLDPRLIKAYLLWGQALVFLACEESKNTDERKRLVGDAIEKCQRALGIDKKASNALSLWGWALWERYNLLHDPHDLEEAQERLKSALALDPSNRSICSNLAKVVNALGKAAEADDLRTRADYLRNPWRRRLS